MFLNNVELTKSFCKYFNSHLVASDFVKKAEDLLSGKAPLANDSIILPVKNKEIFLFLIQSNYPKLINEVFLNLKIENSCVDIFLSEFCEEDFSFLKGKFELEKGKNEIKIDYTNLAFVIDSSEFIVDLIIMPFSQLHTEVLTTTEQFREMVKIVEGEPRNLFLNAMGSTAFSQYIQMFVAANMNISLNGIS